MNRGSAHGIGIAAESVRQASMRPRFMNRGSSVPVHGDIQCLLRFNEAPIHESGKCVRHHNHHASRCRFNEAPIHESGKSNR